MYYFLVILGDLQEVSKCCKVNQFLFVSVVFQIDYTYIITSAYCKSNNKFINANIHKIKLDAIGFF